MNGTLAPIAVFGYRRPTHLARLFESLRANEEHEHSPIYVFLDGPRGDTDGDDVARTREIARAKAPAHAHFVDRATNAGLANSVIAGVSRLTREYGRVIALEDDLVLSRHAIRYFNEALNRYAGEPRVMHIAGYLPPLRVPLPETFFYREPSCWGWATWDRAWAKFQADGRAIRDCLLDRDMRFDFDAHGSMNFFEMLEQQIAGRNDSWAIRWYGSVAIANGLALLPGRSLIANRGFDGTGRHSHETNMYDVKLADSPIVDFTGRVEESREALAAMIAFRKGQRALHVRAYRRLERLYRRAISGCG